MISYVLSFLTILTKNMNVKKRTMFENQIFIQYKYILGVDRAMMWLNLAQNESQLSKTDSACLLIL